MNSPRLVIVFHRLGPYHWARLQAAARVFNLFVIEESAETSEYAWDKVEGNGGFQRITLFKAEESALASSDQMASRMAFELDRIQPSVVAIPGWSNVGGLVALGWSLRRGIPAVLMSESTADDRPRVAWKEWLKRRVVALCSAALAGGEPHREYLQVLGMAPARISLGYDVVDNAHFEAGANAVRNEDSARASRHLPAKYFLASSRFLPQKNLFCLLDAYAAYREAAGSEIWGLVLLGDGPMKAEIVTRQAALGLEHALVLPSFKQYDELPAYYGLASAFVHTATSEPWGLVVNEALAAGLPVIVSERCGCARDLIEEGRNGWTFDPRDTVALTERMLHVSRKDGAARSAMAEAGREIVAHWSLDRFVVGLTEAVGIALATPLYSAAWLDIALLRLLVKRRRAG